MISGVEVLKKSYDHLKNNTIGKLKEFENEIFVVVARDADWHRIKDGYMAHKDAIVYSSDKYAVIVSYGRPAGEYPIEPFGGGRIVFVYYSLKDPYIQEFLTSEDDYEYLFKVEEKLRRWTRFFRDTLLIGLKDGSIVIPRNRLDRRVNEDEVRDNFEKIIKKYEKEEPTYNENYLDTSSLPYTYLLKKSKMYDEKIIEEISRGIEKLSKKVLNL